MKKTLTHSGSNKFKKFKAQLSLHTMLLPGLVCLLLFSYFPMVGIIMAFEDFEFITGIFGSEWVGFKHFSDMLSHPDFWNIIRNTVIINALKMVFSFPIPILFAILLNELMFKRLGKLAQTFSYLPNFISWVIVAGLFGNLFALDGPINGLLGVFGIDAVHFMAKEWFFWPLMVISGVWKTMGWNAIVYIAAMSGISPSLYEAASVDGAGRFKKVIHITLPSLVPTITITLLFNFAGLFTAGFDQIYLFQNDLNLKVSEVLDTYIYKYGLGKMLYSRSAAAGLFQSVINLATILVANKVAVRLTGSGLY